MSNARVLASCLLASRLLSPGTSLAVSFVLSWHRPRLLSDSCLLLRILLQHPGASQTLHETISLLQSENEESKKKIAKMAAILNINTDRENWETEASSSIEKLGLEITKLQQAVDKLKSKKQQPKKVKLDSSIKPDGYALNYNDLLDCAVIVVSGV